MIVRKDRSEFMKTIGNLVSKAFTLSFTAALSVIITAYSLLVIAIVTGVVVNYYNQVIAIKDKETMIAFLDQVERLPELSKEELKTLSDQVKQFRKTGKIKKEPESGG